MKQTLTPPVITPLRRAVRIRKRKTALHSSLSRDQIAKCLNAGQIHLAVDKGPTRKLTCICLPQPIELPKRTKHRRYNRTPAMDMEFGTVFARKNYEGRGKQSPAPGQATRHSGPENRPVRPFCLRALDRRYHSPLPGLWRLKYG